jgi:GWxTD domain-containing protein
MQNENFQMKTNPSSSKAGRSNLSSLGSLLLLLFFIFTLSFATAVKVEALEFYIDLTPYIEHVTITYEIPYDQLQFVKQPDGYLSIYNFIVIFEDEHGNVAKSDFWRKSFKIENYDETLLQSQSIFGEVSLYIPPGNYRLITRLEDLNSSVSGLQALDVQVPEIKSATQNGLALSGIMFLKKISESNGEPIGLFNPNPRRIYSEEEELAYLFEVYSDEPLLLSKEWKIEDHNNQVGSEGKETIEDREWILVEGKLKYYKVRLTKVIAKFGQGGEYILLISVNKSEETKEGKNGSVTISAPFNMDFSPFFSPETFTEKIKQMEYIATPEEMKELKSSLDGLTEDWEKAYMDFWKKHDPTPNSERNELEEAYFQRIEIANEKFTPPDEGWRSDRGRIFVKFGPPDEIREQPFSVSSNPFEIWYYYGPNYEFLFVDDHGIGRYYLKNREEELRAERERQ